MEEQGFFGDDKECVREVFKVKLEDDEEEFRSCCEDEDELRERENCAKDDSISNNNENSVSMYFKGVSVSGPGDSNSRVSGIGVIIEDSRDESPIRIQKKLDFYVEKSVADYLALLDGLSMAINKDIKRISAFTDSEDLCNQIIHDRVLDNPLLYALRQRILEQVGNLDSFVLKHVPAVQLQNALHLAKVAIGVVSYPAEADESKENCSVCCEEKLSSVMIKLKCSHKFCSHCLKTYVEGRLKSSEIPIKCPQSKCRYCISSDECRSFLPYTSYESLERVLTEANALKIYCPYPDCLILIDPHECLSTSSSRSDNGTFMECHVCQRFICVECGVPWHSSMTCEEYQNLPSEERDASDSSFHRLQRNKRSRLCQQCRRMVELDRGGFGYLMRCRCGHDFCYSCGSEYVDGEQTCECVASLWDEDYYTEDPLTYPTQQQFEQWTWDSFVSLPTMMRDAYSDQERSQLALIQRFLAGGFGLSDHHQQQPYFDDHCQSPPRCADSYADAMKDLHQLPWLERFVSVITDDYYEDYVR